MKIGQGHVARMKTIAVVGEVEARKNDRASAEQPGGFQRGVADALARVEHGNRAHRRFESGVEGRLSAAEKKRSPMIAESGPAALRKTDHGNVSLVGLTTRKVAPDFFRVVGGSDKIRHDAGLLDRAPCAVACNDDRFRPPRGQCVDRPVQRRPGPDNHNRPAPGRLSQLIHGVFAKRPGQIEESVREHMPAACNPERNPADRGPRIVHQIGFQVRGGFFLQAALVVRNEDADASFNEQQAVPVEEGTQTRRDRFTFLQFNQLDTRIAKDRRENVCFLRRSRAGDQVKAAQVGAAPENVPGLASVIQPCQRNPAVIIRYYRLHDSCSCYSPESRRGATLSCVASFVKTSRNPIAAAGAVAGSDVIP